MPPPANWTDSVLRQNWSDTVRFQFFTPEKTELAQLIVNTHSFGDIDPLIEEIDVWIAANAPNALVRIRKYGVGPSDTWKFEAQITGPGEADFGTLRGLGARVTAILEASPLAKEVRTDMRQRVAKIVPDYLQERARWADVSRENIARSTQRSFDGAPVGLYREGRDLYPILLRHSARDRSAMAAELEQLQAPDLAPSTETGLCCWYTSRFSRLIRLGGGRCWSQ